LSSRTRSQDLREKPAHNDSKIVSQTVVTLYLM
jgi:hypothetical protein